MDFSRLVVCLPLRGPGRGAGGRGRPAAAEPGLGHQGPRHAGALAELTAEEMGNNAAKRENAFFGLYKGTVVFDFL